MPGVSPTLLLALLATIFTSVTLRADNALSLTDAWIAEAPPTVSVLAGYLTIKNDSEKTQTLTAVYSPTFKHIEIHRSIIRDNGMASMEQMTELIIPAGETVRLAPGGYHLMLFEPALPLRAGDNVALTFSFTDGYEHVINADVRKRSGNAHHH